jgi:hypothetical protein
VTTFICIRQRVWSDISRPFRAGGFVDSQTQGVALATQGVALATQGVALATQGVALATQGVALGCILTPLWG